MKEIQVRQKLFRLLGDLGYWPITQMDTAICGRCGAKIKPPIGRPDIIALHPREHGIVVEVKTLTRNATSFSFSNITPEQRRWLEGWCAAGGLGYIGLGVIRPAGKRDKLEHLYLVDWHAWWFMETLIEPIQASIPLVAGKGTRKALQETKSDIVTLLRPWELSRSQGFWRLPPDHAIWPKAPKGDKERVLRYQRRQQ